MCLQKRDMSFDMISLSPCGSRYERAICHFISVVALKQFIVRYLYAISDEIQAIIKLFWKWHTFTHLLTYLHALAVNIAAKIGSLAMFEVMALSRRLIKWHFCCFLYQPRTCVADGTRQAGEADFCRAPGHTFWLYINVHHSALLLMLHWQYIISV